MSEDVAAFRGIPDRVELGDGVVLRAYADTDLRQVVDAVNEELDHLRPFMPWAGKPVTEEEQAGFLQRSIEARAAGTDFTFGLFRGEQLIGAVGLHGRRGPNALEIGYWLRAGEQGRGLVTRSTRALTIIAAALPGVERVYIYCDEANERSAAVPRRLGYTLAGVEDREITAPGETGRHLVWTIDAATVRGWSREDSTAKT